MKKPAWLVKRIELGKCDQTRRILRGLNLNTVCEAARCPNLSECFFEKTAAFLILGPVCTRGCKFCNIERGIPAGPDPDEPRRVAQAVQRLGLGHAVITSVSRDDLEDGGASQFVETIEEIRRISPQVTIETLIPDFLESLEKLAGAGPDIINHNLETVKRLYPFLRRKADYTRSLEVLERVKNIDSDIYTKSGLMLGLGEAEGEVMETILDLRQAGCDFLSIGQYLAPSSRHFPVKEYLSEDKFDYYKREALNLGFRHVVSSAYARSSYLAVEYLDGRTFCKI